MGQQVDSDQPLKSSDQLPSDPTGWLLESIRRVPALKYALGVVGLVAAASISIGFVFGQWRYALFGGIAVLAAAFLIQIYTKFQPEAKQIDVGLPLQIIVWTCVSGFVLLVSMGLLSLAVSLFGGISEPKPAVSDQTSSAHTIEKATFKKGSEDVIELIVRNPSDQELLIQGATLNFSAITKISAVAIGVPLNSTATYSAKFPEEYETAVDAEVRPFELPIDFDHVIRAKSNEKFEIKVPRPKSDFGKVFSFSMTLNIDRKKVPVGEFDLVSLNDYWSLDVDKVDALSKKSTQKNREFERTVEAAKFRRIGDNDGLETVMTKRHEELNGGPFLPPWEADQLSDKKARPSR